MLPIKDLLNPSPKIPVKDLLNPEPAQAGSSTDANTTVGQTETKGKKCSDAKGCSNPAEEGKSKCRSCLENDNQKSFERREARKKAGICTRCKEKLDTRTGSCSGCSKKLKEYNKEYYKANKET